jgi:hypothetical protein
LLLLLLPGVMMVVMNPREYFRINFNLIMSYWRMLLPLLLLMVKPVLCPDLLLTD